MNNIQTWIASICVKFENTLTLNPSLVNSSLILEASLEKATTEIKTNVKKCGLEN